MTDKELIRILRKNDRAIKRMEEVEKVTREILEEGKEERKEGSTNCANC